MTSKCNQSLLRLLPAAIAASSSFLLTQFRCKPNFFYIYTLAMLRWMLVFAAFLACSLFHFNKCQTYCIGISLGRWMHSMSWIRCVCFDVKICALKKVRFFGRCLGFCGRPFFYSFFYEIFFEQKIDLKNLWNKKIRSENFQFIRSENSQEKVSIWKKILSEKKDKPKKRFKPKEYWYIFHIEYIKISIRTERTHLFWNIAVRHSAHREHTHFARTSL